MIRYATELDLTTIAFMLQAMYKELEPDEATDDKSVYLLEIVKCYYNSDQYIFIDDDKRGFFIIVDETEPMTPNKKVFNGTRVFIYPEHRNGRVLKEFYDTMFKEFPDGDILGLTVVQSDHIKVLEKRHTRIANLYKLKRS